MNQPVPQRNRFLRVLCTLSFLNAGTTIFFNLPALFGGGNQETVAQPAVKTADPQIEILVKDFADILERFAQHERIFLLSTLLLAAMSLMGTWMMWNLKKAGFLFYTTAQLLWTLMPLVFLGSSGLLYLAVGLNSVLTIAFLIMYATQLKHMS